MADKHQPNTSNACSGHLLVANFNFFLPGTMRKGKKVNEGAGILPMPTVFQINFWPVTLVDENWFKYKKLLEGKCSATCLVYLQDMT